MFQALLSLLLIIRVHSEVELLELFYILRNCHTDFGFRQTVFEVVASLAFRTGMRVKATEAKDFTSRNLTNIMAEEGSMN